MLPYLCVYPHAAELSSNLHLPVTLRPALTVTPPTALSSVSPFSTTGDCWPSRRGLSAAIGKIAADITRRVLACSASSRCPGAACTTTRVTCGRGNPAVLGLRCANKTAQGCCLRKRFCWSSTDDLEIKHSFGSLFIFCSSVQGMALLGTC